MRVTLTLTAACLSTAVFLSASAQSIVKPELNPAGGNPIIKNKYTADSAALVYKDKVYIYASHDEAM